MKTILITGATSGFGLAAAKLLAKEGHRLILIARRTERLETLKKELDTDVYTATVDVTDKQQVDHFFATLPEAYQAIDVLVNNAGLALGMDPAQTAKLDDWEQMVETNIKGLLRITKPVLEGMAARKSGLIINLGSVAGTVPYVGGNVYGATKAFVKQFSRNLRADLLGTGVKVTNLEPAAAETEFAEVRFRDEQKGKAFYKGWTPLTADDIAGTILWVINQPPRVNIDSVEIMSVDQSYAGLAIHREK